MSLRDRIEATPRYKWYVLGVLTAVYASSQVDRQVMGIFALGVNTAQTR